MSHNVPAFLVQLPRLLTIRRLPGLGGSSTRLQQVEELAPTLGTVMKELKLAMLIVQ